MDLVRKITKPFGPSSNELTTLLKVLFYALLVGSSTAVMEYVSPKAGLISGMSGIIFMCLGLVNIMARRR